jgi:hypothetical protein
MTRASRVTWVLAGLSLTGCAAAPAPVVVASTEPVAASTPAASDAPAAPVSEVASTPVRVAAGDQRAELVKAKASFEAFLVRAQGKPEYEKAVEEAKERIQDIDRMLIFIGDGGTLAAPAP